MTDNIEASEDFCPQNEHKEEMQSSNITELVKALVGFNSDVVAVKAEALNPFFNSNYADLNSIFKAIRPALVKNKLAVSQGNRYCTNSNGFYVTTMLMHESGQWIKSEVRMPIGGKKDAHAVGGACTYGRRYGLSAILGISVDADDDGNSNTK